MQIDLIPKQLLDAILLIAADRDRFDVLVKQIEGLRTSGAIEMKKSAQGLSLHVEPTRPAQMRPPEDGAFFRINSNTVATADAKFNYKLILQKTGSTTSWDGFEDLDGTEYDGRSSYEDPRLTNAGYQNASVTGLYPIANNTIVWGWPRIVNNEVKIIFLVPNEPKCG